MLEMGDMDQPHCLTGPASIPDACVAVGIYFSAGLV